MKIAIILSGFVFGLLLLAFPARLSTTPPPWWDEGWTLALARNWSEDGVYGQLKLGEVQSPGLAGALPIVAPIAFSFRLFEPGIWQGRMVGLLFTGGTLLFTYLVAVQLFNRKIAISAWLGLLFLLPHPLLHPLLVGRQVLGDVPVVAFLLAGYYFMYKMFEGSRWYALVTCLCWGLALVTKGQTLPFWLIGLLFPVALAVYRRDHTRIAQWIGVGVLSWAVASALLRFQTGLMSDGVGSLSALPGLISIVALVTDPHIRMTALQMTMMFGLPTILGLIGALAFYASRFNRSSSMESKSWIQVSLFGLSGSWFVWYVLLSNGGIRYLASPLILGGTLTAAGLYRTTNGFQFRETIRRAAASLRMPFNKPQTIAGLFSVVLVFLLAPATVLVVLSSLRAVDNSVADVSDYLHAVSAPGSIVETYESELFVYLDRPYHYPPDQLHVDYLRRFLLEPDLEVAYDPLSADPDYLVVGAIGEAWHVYDSATRSDEFRLIQEFSRYKIYERIR